MFYRIKPHMKQFYVGARVVLPPPFRGLVIFCCALFCLFARETSAAEIFWVSDPVQPGEAVMVIGEDFGRAPSVIVTRLGQPEPERARTFGPDKLLSHTEQAIVFELPPDEPPGAYEIKVEGGLGKPARRSLNVPAVYWLQGDGGITASPGGKIRVFGRNMIPAGGAPYLKLQQENSSAHLMLAPAGGDLWEADFALPETLEPGEYIARLNNGLGGERSEVSAGRIEIRRTEDLSSSRLFDVRQFGAKADGRTDDSGALAEAIAAAGKNGGTVYLGTGRYRISKGLVLGRHVTLAGAGRERTALMFDDFVSPPPALIAGSSHFGVRDLSIFASNHNHIIAGIRHDRADAERGDVAIERIRVRAMDLRGHPTAEDVARQFKLSLRSIDMDTLRLGGPNLKIIDNDLLGSGRSFGLYDPRGAIVAGNTIYTGRLGWYSFTGSDGVIFENNKITGADLMSSGGGSSVLFGRAYSRNVIYRNNRFERFLGEDREAVTSDGGGGYIYGSAIAVTSDQVRVSGEINEKWANTVADWAGAGFFILGGRGRGQWARVKRIEGDLVMLDRPLAVPPDASSIITVTQLHQNELFIGNSFEDVGSAIQYYGTSIDNVAADNRAVGSFGFLASGRWYRHYQPSWYCQFIRNEVADGNVYRSGPNVAFSGERARIGLWGLQRPPNRGPLLLGGVLRGNRLRDVSYIELKGGDDASAPGVSDVIVENNSVETGALGFSQDVGIAGAVVRRNAWN